MEDYNKDYDPYEDPSYYDKPAPDKSIKGLKIMILVLAIILAGLSVIYFMQVRQMQDEFAVERDTLTNRLTLLMTDLDNLQTENDTISQHLDQERLRVDSLMDRLKNERRLNLSKIRSYEKQMGYMRTVMEGYVRQIDSLNQLNHRLIGENQTFRREITSARLRAEVAEEKASELTTKVRQGAVVSARDIALLALNQRDVAVTRASRAARLRVDFVLSGNVLATPGERNVYVRIVGPDGYVMTNSSNSLFNYEGDMITYSATRSVDYQNEDLSVSVFYNGSGITAGTYSVTVYMDGQQIGSNEIILR